MSAPSIAEVTALTQLAETILATPTKPAADFLAIVERYLRGLDELQKKFTDASGKAADFPPELLAALEKLSDVHGRVTEQANTARELVGEEMAEVGRKGHALRAYNEGFHSRITLTGKRKG